MGKSKHTTTSGSPTSLSANEISQVKSTNKDLAGLNDYASFKPESGEMAPTLRVKLRFGREKIKEILDRVDGSMGTQTESEDQSEIISRLLTAPPIPGLNVDDAVVVLHNISFSSPKETVEYNKDEIDRYMRKSFPSLLSNSGAGPSSQTQVNKPSPMIKKPVAKKEKNNSFEIVRFVDEKATK